MRTEKEMLDLIINTAQEDERIRAVCLSGSRVNPNAPKDRFQDYDIMYIVTETASFRKDKAWIDRFGERLYMQYPEESPFGAADSLGCYGWLIQFTDGNRLDLHVCTLDGGWQEFTGESMYRVLLDKDRCIKAPGAATDREFWVKRPTQEEFFYTCNEFYWCLNNVAKGLWRKELLYVFDQLNNIVRPMLLQLLTWKVGADTDFSVSVGKCGKYLYRWLSEDAWKRLLQTYPRADTAEMWNAVFLMCDLFEETIKEVSCKLDFSVNWEEAVNSRQYLETVRTLTEQCEEKF